MNAKPSFCDLEFDAEKGDYCELVYLDGIARGDGRRRRVLINGEPAGFGPDAEADLVMGILRFEMLDFLLLTERPDGIRPDFIGGPPPNLFVGAVVRTQADAERLLPGVAARGAPWRPWVVVRGEVDLASVKFDRHTQMDVVSGGGQSKRSMLQSIPNCWCRPLEWVVVWGDGEPLHPRWLGEVADSCELNSVPLWFEGWGRWCHWSQTTSEVAAEIGAHADGPIDLGSERSGRLFAGREWNEVPKAVEVSP